MQLREDLPLVHDWFDTSFVEDSGFAHFFHGKILFAFLLVYLPNFAEPTLSDTEMIMEAWFADSYGSKISRLVIMLSNRKNRKN